jgi:hypothetical protein
MKKLWLITTAVVLVGVIGGGVYVWSIRSERKTVSSTGESTAQSSLSPTLTPFTLATWTDDAGFSFQYPNDLSVNKHEEDNDNYAHVELTSATHSGSIIVWASDLPAGVTTLDRWVSALYATGTSIDTTLGGEPAKKILVSTPSAKLIVGTISDSLLFYIDGTLTDKPYWQTIEDGVVKSFAFTPDTSAPPAGSAANTSGDTGSVDEEEVVQ